jgi:hypothetical protein
VDHDLVERMVIHLCVFAPLRELFGGKP